MRVLVVPDSFKGSLSSSEVANTIKEGITRAHPDWLVDTVPLADGGEGSLAVLAGSGNITIKELDVCSPDGSNCTAHWGIRKKEAFIEVAQASGYMLVDVGKKDPLRLSSYGTGQLVKRAIEKGCHIINLFLGGSATVDGGSGLLAALGAKFYGSGGVEIDARSCNPLVAFQRLDMSDVIPEFFNTSFNIVSDVSNVIIGPKGGVRVFGPQKGALPHQIEILESSMRRWVSVLKQKTEIDANTIEAGGAAGGMAIPIMVFCNCKVISGADYFIETLNVEERISKADFIITGEGKMDEQSLMGKLPGRIAQLGKKYQKRVIGICGFSTLGNVSLFDDIVPIKTEDTTVDEAVRDAKRLLAQTAFNLFNS